MEDAHLTEVDLSDSHRLVDGVFAVFDGHGGKEVSQFCAKYLMKSLRAAPHWKTQSVGIGECFREALLRLDTSLVTPKGQASLYKLQNEKDTVVCIHRDVFAFLGSPESPVPMIDPLPYSRSMGSTVEKLIELTSEQASLDGASSAYELCPSLITGGLRAPSPLDSQATDLLTCFSSSPSPMPPPPPGYETHPSLLQSIPSEPSLYNDLSTFESCKRKRSIDQPSLLVKRKRTRKVMKRVNPVWERIRQIGTQRGLVATPDALPPRRPANRDPSVSSGPGIEILPREKLITRDTSDMVVIDKDELSSKVPGYDSGTTALIAVVEPTTDQRVKRLTVVNAGDSRCVLCRNGTALEMSKDHAPHLETERKRIERAGGIITEDGRINGKLNLSRAIGDHRFKSRKFPLKDQIVTSWSDIRETFVYEGIDNFLVLACDGIWDAMTSQEVVDFIRPLLAQGLPLAEICSRLCKTCLAKDPEVDPGTDNMSVIIVNFF